jgi:hypothetical protein
MQISRRPLTEEEQAELARLIAAKTPGRVDDWVIGVLAPFALLFVPLLLLQLWFPGLGAFEVPVILALLALGAFIALRLRRHKEQTSGTSLLRADLAGKEAEITRCDVLRVEAVEPGIAQLPAYFLDTSDGHTLFLEGEYLRGPVADGKFPSRHVETARTPLARHLLDLTCSGEKVPPEKTRPPFSTAERRTGSVPVDGDVLLPDDDTSVEAAPGSR